ncbi:hypothetical protein C9J03_26145 [Photobacterium gaetbulicola]|nr:hypothetical protein C9J03_26145 [Photobacterium gaetbulicola]
MGFEYGLSDSIDHYRRVTPERRKTALRAQQDVWFFSWKAKRPEAAGKAVAGLPESALSATPNPYLETQKIWLKYRVHFTLSSGLFLPFGLPYALPSAS